jgi:hypothetical protein
LIDVYEHLIGTKVGHESIIESPRVGGRIITAIAQENPRHSASCGKTKGRHSFGTPGMSECDRQRYNESPSATKKPKTWPANSRAGPNNTDP